LSSRRDSYGINGKHEEVGSRYSDDQFKGRVLEALRNLEKSHDEARLDFKEHTKEDDVRFSKVNKKIGKVENFHAKLIGIASVLGAFVGFLAVKVGEWLRL